MSEPLEKSDPAEEAAARYMLGELEAGEETEEKPEAAQPREFRYRGKTITVDPETHDVLEELRKEARGANGRLGSELSRTRERLAKLEGMLASRPVKEPDDEETIQPPDPMLATRDIAAWQRQYDAYRDAREARKLAKVEEEYQARVQESMSKVEKARRETEWANKFYSTYDHLDHPEIKPIVAQVYTEYEQEIRSLDPDAVGAEEAYDRLAELADARLVRLKNAGKGVGDTPNTNSRRTPTFESSAGPAPRGKVEEKPSDFSAASWVARQRLKMQGREPRKG